MSTYSTAIKICGIKRPEDARAAVRFGAKYLGLIFVAESPRSVSVEVARNIQAAVEGKALLVGVFKDAEFAFIADVTAALKLDYVQCHGNETPDYLSAIGIPLIKAIELSANSDVDGISAQYRGAARYLLFDRKKGSCDKEWLNSAIERLQASSIGGDRYFLAGGLNEENVTHAVASLKPFAVDVASGVESEPGVKDHERMEAFCRAVLQTDRVLNGGDRK